MTPATRMERMVSFRLSEGEYQQFLRLCRASNARSISEVARSAMHRWLEGSPFNGDDHTSQKLEELEARVARLTAEVERLQQRAG